MRPSGIFARAIFAFGIALLCASTAGAYGDLDLLSRGTVEPNVMIVFDNSGSMRNGLDGSTRLAIAAQAARELIEDLYPDDGAGGYTATVRLGLFTFDWSNAVNGGDLAEPIASDNKQDLLDEIDSIEDIVEDSDADAQAKGTNLSETLVDVGRYFAGEHGFGSYPSVTTTSPIDLSCRENFAIVMTDGHTKEYESILT